MFLNIPSGNGFHFMNFQTTIVRSKGLGVVIKEIFKWKCWNKERNTYGEAKKDIKESECADPLLIYLLLGLHHGNITFASVVFYVWNR